MININAEIESAYNFQQIYVFKMLIRLFMFPGVDVYKAPILEKKLQSRKLIRSLRSRLYFNMNDSNAINRKVIIMSLDFTYLNSTQQCEEYEERQPAMSIPSTIP